MLIILNHLFYLYIFYIVWCSLYLSLYIYIYVYIYIFIYLYICTVLYVIKIPPTAQAAHELAQGKSAQGNYLVHIWISERTRLRNSSAHKGSAQGSLKVSDRPSERSRRAQGVHKDCTRARTRTLRQSPEFWNFRSKGKCTRKVHKASAQGSAQGKQNLCTSKCTRQRVHKALACADLVHFEFFLDTTQYIYIYIY